MFEAGLRYPWNDGDGVEELLVGSVLLLLGVLVLPLVLVSGYQLRVVRDVLRGDAEPPAWDEWGDLLVDGLKVWLASLVYAGVPALLLAVAVVAFFVPVTQPSRVLGALLVLAALVSVPLAILAWYVFPAALANLAHSGSLAAAFAPRRLWRVVTDGEYLRGWLLGLVVAVAGGFLGLIASSTVVGAVAAPFVAFYTGVSVSYLFATGAARTGAFGDATAEPPTDDADATTDESEVGRGDAGAEDPEADEETGDRENDDAGGPEDDETGGPGDDDTSDRDQPGA